jgi:hypothetical protein
MAKRVAQNTQIDDTPDYLAKPKKQFEVELDERISLGEEILNRQVSNQEDLAKIRQDYSFWHDFNAELIKRAFNKTTSQYFKDYTLRTSIFLDALYHTPSFQEYVEEAKSKVTQHLNRIKKLKEKLILIEELPNLKSEKEVLPVSKLDSGLSILEIIFSKFHKVAQSLRHRHADRDTLLLKDEYDVQDLLRSILQLNFNDIREEDYSPSYAGGNSRVDFVLKDEEIVVETKMTNDKLKDKEIGSQLLIDIGRYRSHPNCRLLAVFIYDKEDHIRNKAGLINDLEKMSTASLKVRIFINPR